MAFCRKQKIALTRSRPFRKTIRPGSTTRTAPSSGVWSVTAAWRVCRRPRLARLHSAARLFVNAFQRRRPQDRVPVRGAIGPSNEAAPDVAAMDQTAERPVT